MKPGFYWIGERGGWTVGELHEDGTWDILGYIEGTRPDEVGTVARRIPTPRAAKIRARGQQ